MAEKLWKAVERQIAARLGGRRVPVPGRQRGETPDIEHDWLSLEVKQRRALPAYLHDGMRQAQASRKPGQLPMVVLHQAGRRYDDAYVCLCLKDFVEWFGDAPTTIEDGP